jgi:hypothetical protein
MVGLGGSCLQSQLLWRFQASLGEKLARPISTKKPGVVVHTCHPSYTGGRAKRIKIQDGPRGGRDMMC